MKTTPSDEELRRSLNSLARFGKHREADDAQFASQVWSPCGRGKRLESVIVCAIINFIKAHAYTYIHTHKYIYMCVCVCPFDVYDVYLEFFCGFFWFVISTLPSFLPLFSLISISCRFQSWGGGYGQSYMPRPNSNALQKTPRCLSISSARLLSLTHTRHNFALRGWRTLPESISPSAVGLRQQYVVCIAPQW